MSSGAGSCSTPSTRVNSSSVVTHGEIDVANDLPRNGPSGDVLARLDVARAPVVHEHRAEDVLERAVDRHRLARSRRLADHEAELELEVELAATGRSPRRARCPCGRRIVGAADDDACPRARGSRSAAGASSASAAPVRAAGSVPCSSRARATSRSRRSPRPRTAGATAPPTTCTSTCPRDLASGPRLTESNVSPGPRSTTTSPSRSRPTCGSAPPREKTPSFN